MKPEAWWVSALRLCVLQLGMSPRDFWQLSVREFEALTAPHTEHARIDHIPERETLSALLQRYPDRKKESHDAGYENRDLHAKGRYGGI